MTKAVRTAALLVSATILGTGCWPMHVISSPGVSGIVIDRQTRNPLGGAQVIVSHVWQRDWPNYGVPTVEEALADTRPPLIVTGTNGTFFIPHRRDSLNHENRTHCAFRDLSREIRWQNVLSVHPRVLRRRLSGSAVSLARVAS